SGAPTASIGAVARCCSPVGLNAACTAICIGCYPCTPTAAVRAVPFFCIHAHSAWGTGTVPVPCAGRCCIAIYIGTRIACPVTGGSAVQVGPAPQRIAAKLVGGSECAPSAGIVRIASTVVIIISVISVIIVGRVAVRIVVASPSVCIAVTSPSPIGPSVARVAVVTIKPPTPWVVITIIPTVVSAIKRTCPTVVISAPSIVIDINAHIGGVISPCGISGIIIIAVIVIHIWVYLQAIVLHIAIIAIYVGKYLALQNIAVFIRLLSKIIAIVILFGLDLPISGPLVYLYPFGPVRIYTVIVVIGGRLVRSAGSYK